MLTIVLGLLVFSVLVVFHEFGHFWVARRMGVRVERFSIGFGPVVASKTINGVQYAISAFPLGGYVKMAGDDPRNRDAMNQGDFFAAAWWRRILIAVGGPGANFVLAVILSIVLAWVGIRVPDAPNIVGGVEPPAAEAGFLVGDVIIETGGRQVASRSDFFLGIGDVEGDIAVVVSRSSGTVNLTLPADRLDDIAGALSFPLPAQIGEVVNGTPAYRSGLEGDDLITAIDGETVAAWSDLTRIIHAAPGREITLDVARGDHAFQIQITPMSQEVDGRTIGMIGISPAGGGTFLIQYRGLEGVTRGWSAALETVSLTYSGIARLVTDSSTLSQISGPVAIIEASGNAAKAGLDRLINLAVVLNVALMVFNLLPIPILDGGMIMLSAWEGIRRRPVGGRGLAVYQGIGMAVIGTLLIFVLINDPLRMVQRQRAIDRISQTSSP